MAGIVDSRIRAQRAEGKGLERKLQQEGECAQCQWGRDAETARATDRWTREERCRSCTRIVLASELCVAGGKVEGLAAHQEEWRKGTRRCNVDMHG